MSKNKSNTPENKSAGVDDKTDEKALDTAAKQPETGTGTEGAADGQNGNEGAQGAQGDASQADASQAPAAPTPDAAAATTKAGAAAQEAEGQRQAAVQNQQQAKAAEKSKETPIVKNTTKIAGGVTVQESTVTSSGNFRDTTAYQAAFAAANASSQSALGQFASYLENMDPKKMNSAETLTRNQVTLYNVLMTILIGEKDNFPKVWAGLVAGVKANLKTVFSMTACQRGIDRAPANMLDDTAVRALVRLIQLLRVEAQVGNSALLEKNIRLSDVTAALVNVNAKNNLTRYYSANK